MQFDTPIYLLFLLLVVLVYWRLDRLAQNRMLLVASCFFYGWWDWRFLVLMLMSATVDFILAQKIADSPNASLRRSLLTLSLIVNFGVLGFFKYFDFFLQSTVDALDKVGFHSLPLPMLRIILPPGISFYTFQEVAYIVDVYRGKLPPSRRFVDYGLFICLFPHLIAGPIQHPGHLLPQIQRPRQWNSEAFFAGMMLIVTGLFRKSVIADNAANAANAAFDGRLGHNMGATLIGVLAFALQIYGDFSGYSDIARGSAQLMGFHFMINFRQPYLATSLQDFWRRWHISLSTWLREYLYIPLGGNRHGELQTYRNLLTTMLLGGLWHGASWNFVVWGALHGFWLSLERMFLPVRERKVFRPLGWAVTMLVVGLSWLFFRARTLEQAVTMLGDLRHVEWHAGFGPILSYLAVLATIMFSLDLRLERCREEYPFEKSHPHVAIGAATAFALLMAAFGPMGTNGFIYFQF